MKKEALKRKLDGHFEKIYDALDAISNLLELDCEDEDLAEMSVCFREQIELTITDNNECTYNNITQYIDENF
jgi:hypothetical protein